MSCLNREHPLGYSTNTAQEFRVQTLINWLASLNCYAFYQKGWGGGGQCVHAASWCRLIKGVMIDKRRKNIKRNTFTMSRAL